ncbi:FUSC family protein [Bacillus massilinigeriensis]|uniref:FUSC family protein n=1 Tax=Bacillus massilionigeriensis TaxID=1805475 RepID=UPI00096B1E07|nr:aromatic acid exporter family protein [Bacillus massilionigeriensis]
MKLGARILKTGIAIVLALLLANLLHLPSPVFAGIAAIFAIQPTIYRSYLSIIEQIQGNLIGAITAVLFVLAFGNHIFFIGLAAIIVITINLRLKIENTISLSLVTLIVIMETPGDTFIQFAIIRFSTILLGILSAFIVNLVFLPPKYENKLYYRISDVTVEIIKWIRLTSRHTANHNLLKNDIEKLKDQIIKLNHLYLLYKEERNYFKKNDLVKSRKLVIYRQMINTNKRALDALKKLHRYENEFVQLPSDFFQSVQEGLDCLLHHHEQIMLKFIGKIKSQPVLEDGNHCLNRKELFHLILDKHNELDELSLFHSMQLISAIIDYDENLEHLDMLVTSFHSYHQDENELTIEEERLE